MKELKDLTNSKEREREREREREEYLRFIHLLNLSENVAFTAELKEDLQDSSEKQSQHQGDQTVVVMQRQKQRIVDHAVEQDIA